MSKPGRILASTTTVGNVRHSTGLLVTPDRNLLKVFVFFFSERYFFDVSRRCLFFSFTSV